MGDEGIGIAVVNELKKLDVKVDIYDCGTMGIDILNTIAGYDKVILWADYSIRTSVKCI